MKYLFLETDLKANAQISIKDKEQINYIVNVLRFKKGQEVIVLDGEGALTHGNIALAHKKEVLIQTSEIEFHEQHSTPLNLYFGIPNKLPKLELMLKMGTELGVSNFYPIHTEYSQVSSLGKKDRLNQIIKSAASQSESKFLPVLHEPQNLKDLDPSQKYIACICRSEHTPLLTDLELDNSKSTNILLGPEGGFSETDKKIILDDLKSQAVSLGNKILRLETAGLLALGICSLKKIPKQ